jgi:hypothetical protein
LLGELTYQVIQSTKTIKSLDTSLTNNNQFSKARFACIALVAGQPWLILMVLEGQLPQLWTLVNILYFVDRLILISKETKSKSKSKSKEKTNPINQAKLIFYDLILVLISLYIVYPQAILTLAAIFFPVIGVMVFAKSNDWYHAAKAHFYSMCALWILLLLLSAGAGTLEIVNQIAHSGVGGGIHIGILGVNDLLGAGLNISRMKILDPSYLAIIEPAYFAGGTVLILEIFILGW